MTKIFQKFKLTFSKSSQYTYKVSDDKRTNEHKQKTNGRNKKDQEGTRSIEIKIENFTGKEDLERENKRKEFENYGIEDYDKPLGQC